MKLQQVQRLHFEIAQTALDPRREVGAIKAAGKKWRETAPRFGSHVEFVVRSILPQLSDQLFTVSIAVYISRINKVHAQVNRSAEGCQRLIIFYRSPGAANRPRPKADAGHFHVRRSKLTILHRFQFSCVSPYCKRSSVARPLPR